MAEPAGGGDDGRAETARLSVAALAVTPVGVAVAWAPTYGPFRSVSSGRWTTPSLFSPRSRRIAATALLTS